MSVGGKIEISQLHLSLWGRINTALGASPGRLEGAMVGNSTSHRLPLSRVRRALHPLEDGG